MRRQLDADHVSIDTVDGYAGYWLMQPVRLDFERMRTASEGASYTLVRAEVDLQAAVVRAECSDCGSERSFLEVPVTGQRIELRGDPPASSASPVRLSVEAPFKDHARGNLVRRPAPESP